MLETHPFQIFVPPKVKYFLLGSFTANSNDPGYDWYYGTRRNQFWPILEEVYVRQLGSKPARQELFSNLSMALGDIIYQCQRKKGNSLDSNLINIIYNIHPIETILTTHPIQTIFFSSRFVETRFMRHFKYPDIELITLPSPSPRYARLSKAQKIDQYRHLLPKLLK